MSEPITLAMALARRDPCEHPAVTSSDAAEEKRLWCRECGRAIAIPRSVCASNANAAAIVAQVFGPRWGERYARGYFGKRYDRAAE